MIVLVTIYVDISIHQDSAILNFQECILIKKKFIINLI
jgi:hypothetical protein